MLYLFTYSVPCAHVFEENPEAQRDLWNCPVCPAAFDRADCGSFWTQGREALCFSPKEPVPSVPARQDSFNGQIIQSLCGEGTWVVWDFHGQSHQHP